MGGAGLIICPPATAGIGPMLVNARNPSPVPQRRTQWFNTWAKITCVCFPCIPVELRAHRGHF